MKCIVWQQKTTESRNKLLNFLFFSDAHKKHLIDSQNNKNEAFSGESEENILNVKFIHFASHGNLQAIVKHMVHQLFLVRNVCVVLLLEFYYHFESHKNPSTVLLLIRFVWKQVECDDKFREWKNKEKFIFECSVNKSKNNIKNTTRIHEIFRAQLPKILFTEGLCFSFLFGVYESLLCTCL